MEELIAWLRATIEGDKAAAEALPHGPWQVELGRRGYPQQISNEQAILIAETYTGPEIDPVVAQYIAIHDPRDTVARCEAELKILDELLPELGRADTLIDGEWGGGSELADTLLALLMSGYRHREGFNPEWLQ